MTDKASLNEKPKKPGRRPLRLPGLRIIKTSLAVFLCLIFYALLPLPDTMKVTTALVATIISLRSTIQESFTVSFNRIQSTFLGAIFGLLVLTIKERLMLEDNSLAYALLLSFFAALIIWFSVALLKKGDGAGLGSIVFLIIASGTLEDVSPFQIAVARFFDTLIGIVIALFVNRALPFPSEEETTV